MYKLEELPYSVDALEPYIDALTMEIHHDRHNRAYVDNLNKALEYYPELQKLSINELLTSIGSLPESIRTGVRNNGGGTYNHAFFWRIMSPIGGQIVKGKLAEAIRQRFGSFDQFKIAFDAKAKSLFGSGWAWLVVSLAGDLEVVGTPNQDCPISLGAIPIIGLDVWEHAYYLKYTNHRGDYIAAWWHVVNWDEAERRFREV